MFATVRHPVDQTPAMAWHKRDSCDEELSIMDSIIGRGTSPYFIIYYEHSESPCNNIMP